MIILGDFSAQANTGMSLVKLIVRALKLMESYINLDFKSWFANLPISSEKPRLVLP